MQIVYNLYTKELYNLLSITNNKFRIFKKSTIIIQLNMIKTDKMKCIEKNINDMQYFFYDELFWVQRKKDYTHALEVQIKMHKIPFLKL